MIHCHCKILVVLLQRVSGVQPGRNRQEVRGRPKPAFPGKILTSRRQKGCRVETYSGSRLHERPRRFTWGETWLEVDQIMEQWVTPGYLCFKVRVGDRAYLLHYNQVLDVWEAGLITPPNAPRG